MRDQERIDRVIALLRRAWYRHPALRLGQLLENARARIPGPHAPPDSFYIEDYLWEALLRSLAIKPLE